MIYVIIVMGLRVQNHAMKWRMLFSERELKFTFDIVVRPSVVCAVVQCSCALLRRLKFSAMFLCHLVPLTLAIHDLSIKILRRSSQGNPSVGGVKHKRGSQI